VSAFLVILRVALSGVFLFAGVAKVRDRDGTRTAAVDLGAPEFLAGPIARFLPLAEVLLGILLLPTPTAVYAAWAIGGLLGLFAVAIAISIVSGKQAVCHCFGETSTEPVGWDSVARNVVLASAAGFIAWPKPAGPGASLIGWWESASPDARPALALAVAAIIVAAGIAWVALGLLRQHGRMLLRIEALEQARSATAHVHGPALSPPPAAGASSTPPGLPVGTPLPAFSLKDLAGNRITNATLRTLARPVLLLSSDPNCGPCTSMQPDLDRWAARYTKEFALVVATRGAKEANRKKFAGTGAAHVLMDSDTTLAKAISTMPTPSAIVVDAAGIIRSDVAVGQRGIEALIASLTGTVPTSSLPDAAPRHSIGTAFPLFEFPSASGLRVNAGLLKGSPTLLLFWNPSCGFCTQMNEALRRWEAKRTATSPRLMFISAGDAEANLRLGFTSAMGLDDGFTLGKQLGAPGTPSAVLVDGDGRIASDVAVGEPAIWRLLGVDAPPAASTAS